MSTIPKRFLFRFRLPCRHTKAVAATGSAGIALLDESYRLPSFSSLEVDSDGNQSGAAVKNTAKSALSDFFDLRLGWNEKGLALSLDVVGKRQRLWCRSSHPEESDGLQICLDTRNVKDIHRATRFCHRLVFLPTQNPEGKAAPFAAWLPIHRAKDHPNPIDLRSIRLSSHINKDGYRMGIFIPDAVLTGYNPLEHPEIGFLFALTDHELGNRYFPVQPPLPVEQDPSLWATLELVSE